jgi:uroporphyrin-III C-methyltransferase/precorrin-2 dehydrogenase/sirohydrochlorin ferrochelatase
MRALPLFHRIAGQPVIVLGAGDGADAKRRLVERAGGYIVEDDNREAKLAFIDLAEPELPAVRLRSRGVLVNVVDRPELCDFYVPSLLDRDPVIVAVGTAGASAGLAKQLRLRLESLLPASLGRLAAALEAAKGAMRAKWPEAAARRAALDAALGVGGTLDPLDEASAERVAGWLDDAGNSPTADLVTVELRSNDPDDLTLREARWLGSADFLVVDAGVATEVLARARADAVRIAAPPVAPLPAGRGVVLRAPGR